MRTTDTLTAIDIQEDIAFALISSEDEAYARILGCMVGRKAKKIFKQRRWGRCNTHAGLLAIVGGEGILTEAEGNTRVIGEIVRAGRHIVVVVKLHGEHRPGHGEVSALGNF